MNKYWKKKSQEEIKTAVFDALSKNINYEEANILGVPASYLDDKVFNQDASFIKDAPFISTLIQNPNHIGCHTLGKSESFFSGTQQIERETLNIVACDVLRMKPDTYDGYVASGGTEANLQAIWIYRNYFIKKYDAKKEDIAILCSEDSHYSMDKAANVLSLDILKAQVDPDQRTISEVSLDHLIEKAQRNGKKHFIVICNMMTTMFGSVDDVQVYIRALKKHSCSYKIHVDGAYGGFYFPFTSPDSDLTFENEEISSFTLDAHKMAQAPYGTGIFLIRKGLIEFANTREASYVEGEDYTLIGSRSGANAIAIWMILMKNGPYGWEEKVFILQKRAEWMCGELQKLDVKFYRHPRSNIITIRQEYVEDQIAKEFGLVPDNHDAPNWYKIVIMEHVTIDKLKPLLEKIKNSQLILKEHGN